SATVTDVLELNQNSIGVCEVQFRRAFLRSSPILHSHADVMSQRADRSRLRVARLDAVALERLDASVRIERIDVHAEVVDRGRTPSRGRAAARKHEELDAGSDRQRRRSRTLK